MIRLLFFFFASISVSHKAFACFTPIKGEEYNAQINVVQIDETQDYTFRVPLVMEGRNKLFIKIFFGIKTEHGFGRTDEWLQVSFDKQDEYAIGGFSLNVPSKQIPYPLTGSFPIGKDQTFYPYVHVVWYNKSGGGCGIVAKSDYLEPLDV